MADCPPLRRASRSIRGLLALTCGLVAAVRLPAVPVDDNPPPGWWRDATFYEIFVRSFADASTGRLAGDGIGDLQGLIEHLDYLNDGQAGGRTLGVNALWLMPIQPSPSYHGYDVTDYFAVNPQYGDVALLKRLVQEAHRRGIRIIIDQVLNHCSSEHPLFRQALRADNRPETQAARQLFRFAPLPEELAGPWGERVWHPVNGEFYYGVFTAEMPDWNFRNPAVTELHRKNARFWLQEVGVDGFRLDAVPYYFETGEALDDTPETRQWLHDFVAYCHSLKPGAFVIGENSGHMREVSEYIRGGALDSAFEFDLAKSVVEAVQLNTPGILLQAVNRLDRLYAGDSPWSSFLSNHDQERIWSQLGGDAAKARLAAELLFTLPGVPFIYYGEELGVAGVKPDPELRTPMPWSGTAPNAGFTIPGIAPWHPLTGDTVHVNVASEDADPHSLLALYRQLIRLNAASPALRHGTAVPLTMDDRGTYAVMRTSAADAVLILANFGAQPRPGPAVTVARSAVHADWVLAEEIQHANLAPPSMTPDGGFNAWRPVAELAPRTAYVLRWTKR